MSAPTVTLEGMLAKVADSQFLLLPDGRTTLCILTMTSGFTVRGESSCVCKENYNQELGEKYAREDAVKKLWPMEGYLLAEDLYRQSRGDVNHDIGWAVRQAKNGKRVAREGWNAPGQWVSFSPDQESVDYTRFWSDANKQFAKEQPTGCVPVSAGMTLKNAQGMIVMGWVPSTSDLLMQDWEIVF